MADQMRFKSEQNKLMDDGRLSSLPGEGNSPSENCSSEGPPEKRMKRDSKQQTDTNRSTDEYMKKRARNNLAVKKSRDRSKQRILETQNRVDQLTKENEDLQTKVTLLSKELNVLRALFTSGGFTLPCNVQIVGSTVHQQHSDSPSKSSALSSHANGSSSLVGHSRVPSYADFGRQQAKTKEQRVENHTSVIRTASTNNQSLPTMAYEVVATGK